MNLKVIDCDFSICKIKTLENVNLKDEFVFLSVTDQEISLVCKTEFVPKDPIAVKEGWKGFRIEGELDFSFIGIVSKISAILAERKISIFVVSTYNTDYVLIEAAQMSDAITALQENGYSFF